MFESVLVIFITVNLIFLTLIRKIMQFFIIYSLKYSFFYMLNLIKQNFISYFPNLRLFKQQEFNKIQHLFNSLLTINKSIVKQKILIIYNHQLIQIFFIQNYIHQLSVLNKPVSKIIMNNFRKTFVFSLFILFCAYFGTTQDCYPQYVLENIIQDQIIMQTTSQNGLATASQTYPYPRTLFSSTPKIIYSMDNYAVSQFSQINYWVSAKVNRFSVDFKFNSTNMQWAVVSIRFWLISRSDILIGSFVIDNINQASQKSFDIAIPADFNQFVDTKIIQLNYITGLSAKTSGNNYEIDVKNSGKSNDNSSFRVTVSAINKTTIQKIQVSYIIFNFESSYFASGGGQLNYKSIKGSQYKKIHSSFSPILYILEGFNKFNLSKNSHFSLEFYFDNDYVLETYSKNSFNQIGVVYLTIGKQPSSVCACDKYIQFDGCIDSCPPLTYPYIDYAKGGKTCLTCSAKLNQTINQFNTGCVCMDGFQRIDDTCLPLSTLNTTTGTTCSSDANSVLSNGVCVCIAGTQKVNGKCINACSTNQFYNSTSFRCECNFGYKNISGVCGTCPDSQIYDSNFQACMCPQFQFLKGTTCECIPGYYNFTNTCVKVCPTGYTVSNNICVLLIQCKSNQVFQNGICTCTNNTYIINGTCSTCPATTYYNSSSQSCINCLAFCNVCFNFTVCAECKKDYYYNSTTNTCIMNTTCKSNEQLSNGICECVNGTYRINETCSTCNNGTYYDSSRRLCLNCPQNCNICTAANNCQQCVSIGFNFIASVGQCVPNCATNQTFSVVTNKCQCINGTFRINNVCTKCPLANFYNPADQQCYPCMTNCLSCLLPSFCDKCINLYLFNQTKGSCEPSNCPINEIIINGKCDCVNGTFRIGTSCGTCAATGQFYNPRTLSCNSCSDNCLKCSNQLTCQQCQPYHRLVNFYCQFQLYDLKQNYPKFTQNLVITDFTSSQPLKSRSLSAQQLQKIVKIQFDDKNLQPKQILINQNPKNSSQIRVIYSYCGLAPLKNYTAKYTFNDAKISPKQDIQNVQYNALQKGYTNFLNSTAS